MSWTHVALAVAASVAACSFTDWLFMGVLFHERYKDHPEVWRASIAGGSESKAIAGSIALSVVTCAAMVGLCVMTGFTTWPRASALAAGVWCAAPLPLLVTNAFFVKFHPLVVVAQALGWLAKLLVCAIAVALVL